MITKHEFGLLEEAVATYKSGYDAAALIPDEVRKRNAAKMERALDKLARELLRD